MPEIDKLQGLMSIENLKARVGSQGDQNLVQFLQKKTILV